MNLGNRISVQDRLRKLAAVALVSWIILYSQLSSIEIAAARVATALDQELWARRLMQSVVAREGARGGDVRLLSQTLSELAEIAWHEERFADAEPLLRRAIAIDEGVSGATRPATLEVLARVLQDRGHYTEAEALYERALSMREASALPVGLGQARALEWQAELHRDQGNFAESEPLYRRALEIRERILPAGDPRVAHSLYGLGALLRHRKEPGRAELYLQRALTLLDGERGRANLEQDGLRVRVLSELGGTYLALRRLGRAEAALSRALEIAERRRMSLARALLSREIAMIAFRRGQPDEAERLLHRTLDLFPDHLQAHHHRAVILTDLATLQLSRGRLDGVDDLLDRAATIAAASGDHPGAQQVMERIEGMRQAQRQRS